MEYKRDMLVGEVWAALHLVESMTKQSGYPIPVNLVQERCGLSDDKLQYLVDNGHLLKCKIGFKVEIIGEVWVDAYYSGAYAPPALRGSDDDAGKTEA